MLKKKVHHLSRKTDNDLVSQAVKNIQSIRKESLQILEIAGDFDRMNEI